MKHYSFNLFIHLVLNESFYKKKIIIFIRPAYLERSPADSSTPTHLTRSGLAWPTNFKEAQAGPNACLVRAGPGLMPCLVHAGQGRAGLKVVIHWAWPAQLKPIQTKEVLGLKALPARRKGPQRPTHLTSLISSSPKN